MILLSSESTSRQSFCMSKTMHLHVDNQHGRSAIKEDSHQKPSSLLFKTSKIISRKNPIRRTTSHLKQDLTVNEEDHQESIEDTRSIFLINDMESK